MHTLHITSMVEDLLKDGVITPRQKEAAQQSLEKYWKERIAITWTVDDILCARNPDEKENYWMDKGWAQTILGDLLDHHNAEYGVNWDTIKDTIDITAEDFVNQTPEKDLPKYINTYWGTYKHIEELYKERLKGVTNEKNQSQER